MLEVRRAGHPPGMHRQLWAPWWIAVLAFVAIGHVRATVVQVDGTIVPVGSALQAALNTEEGVAPPNPTALNAVLDAAELPEIFLPSTASPVTFR